METIGTNERIFDKVYGVLRSQILDGKLPAGEPLSVPGLSRKLGVSRSPVREAVLQLVADGLARSEPRKGACVAEVNRDDLMALHDLREVLEGLSARRAALRIDEAALEELARILESQRRAVDAGDAVGYVETDQHFHARLAAVHGEPRLSAQLRTLADQMRLAVSLAMTDPDHQRRGYEEHGAVLQALRERAPEAAEAAMRAHIAASKARAAHRIDLQQSH